jgi:hypothetical protein
MRLSEPKPVNKEIPAPERISSSIPKNLRFGPEIRRNLDITITHINENYKSSRS